MHFSNSNSAYTYGMQTCFQCKSILHWLFDYSVLHTLWFVIWKETEDCFMNFVINVYNFYKFYTHSTQVVEAISWDRLEQNCLVGEVYIRGKKKWQIIFVLRQVWSGGPSLDNSQFCPGKVFAWYNVTTKS
jgi:hypothetical protein